MGDEKKDVNGSGSSPDKKSVNGSGSQPDENVIAELKRKTEEFSTVKGEVSSLKEQLGEAVGVIKSLQAKLDANGLLSPKDSKKAETVVKDTKALVKQLRAQAEAGDQDALAYLSAIEETVEDRANKIFEERWNKAELQRDFDKQDDVLKGAAKEEGVDVEALMKLIDPFAEPYTNLLPSKQTEKALRDYRKDKDMKAREAKLQESENAEKNFRDNGGSNTVNLKTKDWSKPGSWRDAKTRDEQMQTLHDI